MIQSHQRFVWHTSHAATPVSVDRQSQSTIHPHWNELTRELLVEDLLVKKYRGRAENQEQILTAFQAEHWCHEIPVPLNLRGKVAASQRLRIALDGLNRMESIPKIQFELSLDRLTIAWRFAATTARIEYDDADALMPFYGV